MHICFLTNEYPKEGFPHGGIGSFVKTIAKSLIENNIQVTVLGLNYIDFDEDYKENEIRIVRLKRSTFKGLAWYFNFKKINKEIRKINEVSPIDIIEASELGLAFIQKLKGIQYIIRLHGGHHFFAEAEKRGVNKWKGFQEKRSFQKANAFIAVSNYVKAHTEKYLSYNLKKVKIIFNPINLEFFNPKTDVEIKKNSIVFAGSICEKKGVRQLIQAFPLVKEKFPDAILNVYGRDWFFPDGSSYITMLKTDELPKVKPFDEAVYFKGTVPYNEIPMVYSQAEVCVFPSHMETLGLVAPEAMACEKPVVFTNLGPGNEVINNGVDGLTVNPYSPEEIANAIIQVFENKEKAQLMSKNARQTVLQKFNPEIVVQQNIDFYNEIIAK